MPEGLVFRSPREQDAPSVASVINATSRQEIGVDDTTEDDLRASWARPDRDRERDLIVAELDGRVVAYLEIDAVPPWTSFRIDGYVDPAATGRGIGSALLDRGQARGAELAERAEPGATVKVFHGVWHGSRGARLLEGRGWRRSRVFWRMVIEMDAPPPEPVSPDGVMIRTVRPGEEREVHHAVSEAFQDHWEHRPIPFERWLHDYREQPAYEPTLWFVADDAGETAGVVLCKPFIAEDPECAEIETLSVRRPWRRRGLALAMLRHALGAIYARGIRKAVLTVDADSPTGATGLYEKAGLRPDRRIDVYEMELTPTG